MEKMINNLLIDPQLLWDPTLGNRVLGVDDLSPRNVTNELLTVNRHYRFMLDSIFSGIIEFDQNQRIIYANPAALRIFSMSPEVMLGNHLSLLFNEKAYESILSLIHSSKPEGVPSDRHVKMSIGNYILDVCVAPFDYSQDTQVIIMEDITIRETTQTKLIEANNKLEVLAHIDSLTEVFNRRHFDDLLHQEWGRLKREKGELSLILCDVDYFKNYNDTYGHLKGDQCLRLIAQTINSTIHRPSDMVARYGGDEFVLLLPNTALDGAQHLAEEILNRICQLQIRHEESPLADYVTITIGAGTGFPNEDLPEDKFIWLADKALYEAKRRGRNCVIGKTWSRQ